MNTTDTNARGLVRIAMQRLAGNYPFHARILERFALRCRTNITTMAVTVTGDNVLLLYNPDFVCDIHMEEVGGVLLHEVHHVVFGHILADPADYPDHWARTVAEEVTVNEFVKEPLPGEPILLGQFPELPKMESTDQRYKRLMQRTDRAPSVFPCLGSSGLIGAGLMTVDDHSVWEEARQDLQRSENALRAVVQDAVIDVGIENVPEELRERIRRMGIGRFGGRTSQAIGETRGKIKWVQFLRRFVGRHLKSKPDFRQPPRRFPHLVGVFPGRRRRQGRPHILVVIDTSASMTIGLLEQVNGELSRLATEYLVTVVECDAKIQQVYPYRRVQSVQGRGGTDLRPVFEPSFMNVHRPDLIVYFTDGQGPAPTNAPPIPVLWCLTPHGVLPTTWGQTIKMEPESV